MIFSVHPSQRILPKQKHASSDVGVDMFWKTSKGERKSKFLESHACNLNAVGVSLMLTSISGYSIEITISKS